MSIIMGYMVPHPPIIVPEIGKGGEAGAENTIAAYEKAASEIAELKPDTIIITSPHAVMYRDYFHISPGENAYGDFSDFRAPEVKISVDYDTELVSRISEKAGLMDFPAGTDGEQDKALDHGTMLPLYFIMKKYRDFRIIRIGLSGYSLNTHMSLGRIIKASVGELGRRAVFVASGDLSHCQKKDGPYGFRKEGPEYDEMLIKTLESGGLDSLKDFPEDLLEKSMECGHRSFCIMAGAFYGTKTKIEMLSHEAPFGVGYGFWRVTPEVPDDESPQNIIKSRVDSEINAKNNLISDNTDTANGIYDNENSGCKPIAPDPYVALAASTIKNYLENGKKVLTKEELDALPDEMKSSRHGAFVSIHEFGELRGCIGTILPIEENLALEINRNAISASTEDPRFNPIRPEEFSYLDINVDVLSTPEHILSEDELDPEKYGVIVEKGRRRGLLLPDLDGVDTVERQISIAKQKAGISEDENVELYRFTVKRHT